MTSVKYKELEQNFYFKKKYFNRTAWWFTILLVPPVCLLFVGLVGILYLVNIDMLVSLYAIPYIVLFILGTVWLKGIRKHIQKRTMDNDDAFLVCLGKQVGENDKYAYFAFTTGDKRHNMRFIADFTDSISSDEVISNTLAQNTSVRLQNGGSDGNFYLRAYKKSDLNKWNPGWNKEKTVPLLYIDSKYTFIIKGRDLL